jgi:hypothetical protein
MTVQVPVALRTLARWDSETFSETLNGVRVRGAYIIDSGLWKVAVGECSGAGGVIGLDDAVPCLQQNTSFIVPQTIIFNGKH